MDFRSKRSLSHLAAVGGYALLPYASALMFSAPQMEGAYSYTPAEWLSGSSLLAALWYAEVVGSYLLSGLRAPIYQALSEAQLLGCILFLIGNAAAFMMDELRVGLVYGSLPLSILYGIWRLRKLHQAGSWVIMPYFIAFICFILNKAGILPGI